MKFTLGITRIAHTAMVAGALLLSAAATAQSNPYARGPNPTTTALEASRGPFAFSSFSVTRPNGFGAGTVYYPSNAGGTVGAIAIVPGFLARQSSINWWGPRLASHGFVVITIDTRSSFDQPASRATQQMAALRQVVALAGTSSSPLYRKVDTARLGVMGWSMGGGGTLLAARDNPTLKAAAPQAPWNSSTTNFSSMTVPTLIFACESDSTAPVRSHAEPFYNSMTRNSKQYLEINNGSHSCANGGSNTGLLGKKGVAWMKRFMDEDTRYTPFACSNPNSSAVSDFRTANCS